MIKKTFLTITASFALAAVSQATIVSLGGDIKPVYPGTDNFIGGSPADTMGARVTIGTLTGTPASNSTDDIAAVFSEFGTYGINGGGLTSNRFNGSFATTDDAIGAPFDGLQIYIWVVNTPDRANATGSALFTVSDPVNPPAGGDWIFPTHVGNGQDGTSLSTNAIMAPAFMFVEGFGSYDAASNQMVLAPIIPEPSGALLAGLAGMVLVFRRRR